MKTHRVIICFLFIMIALIFSACEKDKETEKISLLFTDQSCNAPCWQNITPGVTSFAQAVGVLSKTMFVKPSEFLSTPQYITPAYEYSRWAFKEDFNETGMIMYNIGDSVGVMQFNIRNGTNIGEMMDFYGEPDFISIASGIVEGRWLSINWFYPAEGIILRHDGYPWRSTSEYIDINSEFPVETVYYFDPNLYDYLLENNFITYYGEVTRDIIQSWSGFGMYDYFEE